MSGPAPARLGIVTGLAAEADRIARAARGLSDGPLPLVFCSGADAGRAQDGAARLIADGAEGLVSFGIAGGLDPALEPGELVLADAVVTPDGERVASDRGWRNRFLALSQSRQPVTVAAIAGADGPLTTLAAKRALSNVTGAAAVDMESHAVARAASAAGVPFLSLRAVADTAARAVPTCALSGVGSDGRMRPLPVLRELVLKPWELPALVAVGRDTGAALASLGRVAELVLRAFARG